ncbi:MAG: phage portal protein [Exiguobacterium sp.]|nr:phage portal protein [Exiguobacterium sp.]
MGLKELLFPKKIEQEKQKALAKSTFEVLNGYVPTFRTWHGEIYESLLVRASIDAIARHASKLAVTIEGGTKSELLTMLKKKPNGFQTWSQFLYRVATILNVQNTAFIIPLRNKFGATVGIYPLRATRYEIIRDEKNDLWIRFHLDKGEKVAERLSDIGILTRYQYKSEFFGDSNSVLDETMQLISIQRQGIEEYAKNASSYRFMAKLTNFSKSEDLSKERQRFDAENFQGGNGGGLLLFPNTYAEIKQITSQEFSVDTEQMKLIQHNVYDYFGANENIIQNKAHGDEFSAFYEGCIEPFAIQLSEVLTFMLFTPRENSFGAGIYFTSNRIQYMNNSDKLAVSRDLADRGVMSINEVREIWQLPPIDGGDIHILRGEYYNPQTGEKVDQIGANNEE